ncbi:MAG TPA: SSI family serine proteinase inhibitor, partial [Thermomonospora sp.]|nr:SSI family serine proteinase inhibitor [Thermomonospora sp.]
LLLPAGTAAAGTAARPALPDRAHTVGAVLRLTVSHPDHYLSGARTVALTCEPAAGTHPNAPAACADLDRTGGRIAVQPADAVCTLEYHRVVGKAVGWWRGRLISFQQTYPNLCALHAHTGSVFRF